MATITIAYSAITAPNTDAAAKICRYFEPNNAAADLPAFAGTYYDTNVEGWGEGMSLETFMSNSIAHPGLGLALKLAVENGSYEFETDDVDTIMYLEEVTDAVADQGFTITVEKN